MKRVRNNFWVRLGLETAWFGAVVTLIFSVWGYAMPTFHDGILQYPDASDIHHFSLPLQYEDHVGDTALQVSFGFNALRFTRLRFIPDDCLNFLEVNEQVLLTSADAICDYNAGGVIDVSSAVHAGDNVFGMSVFNEGSDGGLRIRPDISDPLQLFLLALLLAALGVYTVRAQRLAGWTGTLLLLITALVLAGVVLRLTYVMGTPATVRGYDVDGHMEYIEFLIDHNRLPAEGEGWQWYQPPLYYAVMAVTVGTRAFALQWVSFMMSLLTLGITVLIAKDTLAVRRYGREFWLFLALMVTCPTLIYFAARVNNDVFLLFFAAAAFWCLLRWWVGARRRWWYAASVAICLGLLSKSNAVVLLPVALVMLLLHDGLSWRQKWSLGWRSLVLLILCTEWLVAVRWMGSGASGLVGNIGSLHDDLQLQTTWAHLTVFNPMEVLDHPFVDPWEDSTRRQYFWEYWYRTAFFGEFMPPEHLRSPGFTLLLLHMLTLPLFFWGFIRALWSRWRTHLPMALLMVSILAAHMMFRWQYPFSSSQDFRYSALIVVPAVYFTVLGLRYCPWRARQFYTAVLAILAVAGGLFTFFLAIS